MPFSILVVLNTNTACFCSLFGVSAVAAEVGRCLRPNRFLEAFVGFCLYLSPKPSNSQLCRCAKSYLRRNRLPGSCFMRPLSCSETKPAFTVPADKSVSVIIWSICCGSLLRQL